MPPEKNHRKAKQDSSKIDIYSLGVIIYQMLYNDLPTVDYDKDRSKRDRGYFHFHYKHYKIPIGIDLSLDLLDIIHGCL